MLTGVKSEAPYCWMGHIFSVGITIPIRLRVYASSLPGLVWVEIELKLNLKATKNVLPSKQS